MKPAGEFSLPNGNPVKILTCGEETLGQLTVIEYIDNTQGNPPPFTRHEFVEVFTVLSGTLAFQYDGKKAFTVSAGNAETVASGRSHTFWNPEQTPLRILLACTPAGLDSFFQDMHTEVCGMQDEERNESALAERIALLRSKHGIEVTNPPPNIGDIEFS